MRYVSFYSWQAMERCQTPSYVISIKEPGVKPEDEWKFSCEHKSVLTLRFDDIEQYVAGHRLFYLSDAVQILEWIKQVPEGEVVLVHCHAGVSRSAAVAKFLCDHKGYALLLDKWCNGNMDRYNGHVYGTLRIMNAERSTTLAIAAQEEIDRICSKKF